MTKNDLWVSLDWEVVGSKTPRGKCSSRTHTQLYRKAVFFVCNFRFSDKSSRCLKKFLECVCV